MIRITWLMVAVVGALVLVSCAGDDPAYSDAEGCTSDEACPIGERCVDGSCQVDMSVEDTGARADAGGGGDTQVEDTEVAAPDIGDPCDTGDDCPSGFCIEASGVGRRVCTDFCDPNAEDACPEEYSCAAVTNSGADVTFLCFPEADILCTDCDSDGDCGGLSDLCVTLPDGDFCARDCQLRACPEGYVCTEMDGPGGELMSQCLPAEGICSDCLDPDGDEHGVGSGCLGLDCNEDNEGVNAGAFEACNDIDDNCDGTIDEGYDFSSDPAHCGGCDRVCSFEGAEALCEGGRCVRGDCLEDRYDIDGRVDNGCEYFCERSEDGVEVCNGRDDNCDGRVDEGDPGGGQACDTGEEGICARGLFVCDDGEVSCVRQRDPLPESCNGEDDNCDGRIDEGNPGGGASCNTGEDGVCSDGTLTCMNGGLGCVQLREAEEEVCNGRDDNCDGRIDEGNPGGGAQCDTGEMGVCGIGVERCMGSEVVCVQERQPTDELCNGRDDNCNGAADEGNPEAGGSCDTEEDGICGPGTLQCADGGLVCQRNDDPRGETCNGEDDNCDGAVDEDNPGGGGACDTGQNGICGPGTLECSGGDLVCRRNTNPTSEVCDGVDNDCDGNVDENGCGSYIQENCRIFVGWADDNSGPDTATSSWFGCPAIDRDLSGSQRCVGTRRDGRFARIQLGGDVNGDDELAVALLCDDASNPALAGYIDSHCALYVGQADRGLGTDSSPSWGNCPGATSDNSGDVRCTSSGFDRRFRRMLMTGDVNDDDQLAVAWKCVDAADPNRAAALQASARVYLGWADRAAGAADGSATWGSCPTSESPTSGTRRCVSTRGDGLFHLLQLGGDVNDDDQLGWSLRASD